MKRSNNRKRAFSPGLRMKKRLGQHILQDRTILSKIVKACHLTPETTVLEIGAGVGNLTEGLARKAKKVLSVEIDTRFRTHHLAVASKCDNLAFLYENILDLELESIEVLKGAGDLVIAGNIPYNITSPLIMKILEGGLSWRCVVFMVQSDLARRISAPPGSKESSAITLKIHYFSNPEILFTVPKNVFHPPPKVESAVIRLEPRVGSPFEEEERLGYFRMLDAAFGQRRKTIRNSLGHSLRGLLSREDLEGVLREAGVDPGSRPERIRPEQFQTLFRELGKRGIKFQKKT